MGRLDRWDRHDQRVMDRACVADPAAWTIPAVLTAAWLAMALANRVLPWWPAVAIAWVAIVAVALVALRGARRRRCSIAERAAALGAARTGTRPPTGSRPTTG